MNAIAIRRLRNQGITGAPRHTAADVVEWFGAVQAQEYPHARWALGLRMREGATDAALRRAFDAGRILRTHVMRPTWHFVTPADIRWLLELTGPRVQRVTSSYNRRLGLDGRLLVKAASVFERALGDGGFLTRAELGLRLARGGVTLDSMRLAHAVMYAELEGILCSGPRRGNQFTYALLSSRAPRALRLTREEALAELARRFLRSHGPATIRDFVWWSGLTTPDARRGFEIVGARARVADGHTYWSLRGTSVERGSPAPGHLLPVYDEYLVAYRDRTAVPHAPALMSPDRRGTITFSHALVIDGQVAGTWRVEPRGGEVAVRIIPLRRLTAAERDAAAAAAGRYGRFLEAPISISITPVARRPRAASAPAG